MDKTCTFLDLVFEWDEAKYALNLRSHGVTFEEAAEVFFDSENVFGDASRTDEFREYVTGFSFSGNLLFTVLIERGERVRNNLGPQGDETRSE